MLISEQDRDLRLAVRIDEIPSTLPIDVVAKLPFEDQPDVDIDTTYFRLHGCWHYSIFIALTKVGMLQRALDFVEANGGEKELRTFGYFRERKRGTPVELPRAFVEEEEVILDERKLEADLRGCDIPLRLAEKTLLTDHDETEEEQQAKIEEGFGIAFDRNGRKLKFPFSRAEKRAQLATRWVRWWKQFAIDALVQIPELKEQLRDNEQSRQGQIPLFWEADYDEDWYRGIEETTRYAYFRLLKLDQARQEARLAYEVVLLKDKFEHDDWGADRVEYELVYKRERTVYGSEDGTEEDSDEPSFHPSELPDPASTSVGVKGWKRFRLPRLFDAKEEQYFARFLAQKFGEKGIGSTDYKLDFSSDDEGQQHHLQITFYCFDSYRKAFDLKLFSIVCPGIEHVHSLAFGSNTAVLRVDGIDGIDGKADITQVLSDIFQNSLSRYVTLLYAWRLTLTGRYFKDAMPNGCSILAYACLNSKSCRYADSYELTDLPGMVKVAGESKPLHVAGRPANCEKCHPWGAFTYHTEEQCSSALARRSEPENGEQDDSAILFA